MGFEQSMEEGFIMKKLASIALLGLSLIAVSSFADVSCINQYSPTTDMKDFCACYKADALAQCMTLSKKFGMPSQKICNSGIKSVTALTCTTETGRLSSFCSNNVTKLHQAGDTSVTIQNCEDDVGYICDKGGRLACNAYWG